MFTNRLLIFGFVSLIFGMAISASVASAATLSHGNVTSTQPFTDESLSKPKPYKLAYGETEDVEKVVLNIEGMTCGMCENAVKSALMKCNGVKDAEVSHKKGKAIVQVEEGKAKTDELIKAVEKAGFSASEG